MKSSKISISNEPYMKIDQSPPLAGSVALSGAKNAVLVIIASLILTEGKSTLSNVPHSDDVLQMIVLMRELGAVVHFDHNNNQLHVDTTSIDKYKVSPTLMQKMRASVLVMGPLLARFKKAEIALPGGCLIGARPIDFHIKNFEKMGVTFTIDGKFLTGVVPILKSTSITLEYPSVGTTENIMMAATRTTGLTRIINAALEPEVFDLITILRTMGARITIAPPATIEVEGVTSLHPVEHTVIYDRLEAGVLLLAAAITGGAISLPHASSNFLDVFLFKLHEMGHEIIVGSHGEGITLKATRTPRAVSLITAPYPGFPTDLQAAMMAAQCVASGKSEIHETVFENRLLHVSELQKMGANIIVKGDRALVTGVTRLHGTQVTATDIRASSALMLAGLVAQGTTTIHGIHHWKRGYDALEKKLTSLGASVTVE